jgi:hypothetical protein
MTCAMQEDEEGLRLGAVSMDCGKLAWQPQVSTWHQIRGAVHSAGLLHVCVTAVDLPSPH